MDTPITVTNVNNHDKKQKYPTNYYINLIIPLKPITHTSLTIRILYSNDDFSHICISHPWEPQPAPIQYAYHILASPVCDSLRKLLFGTFWDFIAEIILYLGFYRSLLM